MTRDKVNAIAAAVPLVFSTLALAIVLANIATGVPPQHDEDASAHMWQLLMVAQVPVVVLFAATADWRRWRAPLLVGAQVTAIVIACVPVWLVGY